ncbi:MAG: hypothetical protein KC502_06155 [Myxococcales bacterium]|nr:hypothetical protein [Myxococcales bacterium]
MKRFATVTLLSMFALLFTACGGDTEGGNGAGSKKTYGLPSGVLKTLTSVNTSLSASEAVAGTTITVACVGQPGDVAIPEPVFEITPAEGTKIDGKTLIAERAGSYMVACTIHDGKVKDDSPAPLTITPATAVKTTATAEPTKIASGAKSTITCSGEDAFGNAVTSDKWSITSSDDDIASMDGSNAEGGKVGTAKLDCRLDTAKDAVSTPASLEVIVGSPAKSVATLDPDTFVAGGSSKVTCTVTDAAGNAIEGTKGLTVSAPSDVTVNGQTVTSTKAGSYEIGCALAGGDLKEEKAKLIVKGGAPVEWQLSTKKDKKVWAAGDVAVLVGLGKDQFGNELTWMPIQPPAVYTPKATVKENQASGVTKSYTLQADGNYTFTASLSEDEYGKDVSAKLGPKELKLKVDSTGPLVLISSPERGVSLNGKKQIKVKGTVLDELSGLKSFTLGGKTIKVGSDGSFEIDRTSVWGMNTLKWTATDEWDNVSEGVQTYLYSTKWYAFDTKKPKLASINDGIGMWMSQQVIDSGKHDHKNPKDFATITELVIGTLDFNKLMASSAVPLKSNTGALFFDGKAIVKNVKMGDKGKNNGYPEFAITVIDGGLNLVGKIHNFSADLAIEAKWGIKPLPAAPLNQSATFAAKTIELSFDLLMKLDPKTGKIKADTKNVDVNFTSMKISLNGLVGAVANWLLGALGPALEATLEQVLKGVLQQTLGNELTKAFEGLAINQDIDIPPFFGDGKPTKIKLASNVGQLTFKPTKAQNGGVIVGLDASMTSEKKVKHKTKGAIGRAGCLEPGGKDVFNPGLKFPLEIGLADDFINELLYSLWHAGALNMSIGESALGSVDLSQYGVSKLNVDLDFLLPPILNTCITKKGLKLQVGDMQVHAKLNLAGKPVDIYLFTTLQATAELKAVKNPKTGETELGFSIKGIDFLELEITKINEEAKDMQDLFVTLIKTVMLPKLVDGLGGGLGSFPLPAIDLSSISKEIPAGTSIALAIQVIENMTGYTYMRGALK